MKAVFNAIPINEKIYWVGAVDWAIRDFHGYLTSRGTTYNAFLLLGDPVTLIDTVKRPFRDELLARIASVVDPQKVRVIISNHAEMDHSGCLPEIIAAMRPEKVYASAMGVKALRDHFGSGLTVEAVNDGSRLELGGFSLSFMETRMLHWPDSMFTYLEEEQILFSQDAFGMHLATAERFDDEVDREVMRQEAARYFANILLPYANLVAKLLEKVKAAGLPLRLIAPDHGPIWRKNPATILEWYGRWAAQQPSRKAVVVYDTMWGSTELMARAVVEGLRAGGAEPVLLHLGGNHRSDVATALLGAGALVVGSPTLNNQMFPTIADVLTYLQGLKPRGLVGAAFGSYGWSPKVVPQISEQLKTMGVEVVSDGVQVVYVPQPEDLARCAQMGTEIARRLSG